MKQIFGFLKPYRKRMTVGFTIKILATIVELLIPWALGVMIDRVIPYNNIGYVFAWGGVMILFAVLALSGNITANRMASLVARNTTERIRLQLFRKISYLSMQQQEALTMPSMISRATSDTYNIHQMLGMMQRLGVRQPIMLIGGLLVTATLDGVLTCVMLAMLPVMFVFVWLFSSKGIPMYGKVQEAVDRFVRLVREDIAGIRVIKALSKTDTEREKFDRINEEVVNRDRKAGLVMGVMNPLMSFFLNLGMVLVILIGAQRVNSGLTTAGTIIAFMSYVTIILNSILFMSRMFVMLSKATASAKRITEILNQPEDLKAEAGNACNYEDQIVFDQVSFSYGEGENSLKKISFSLKKGETLGIIGATGSGKSTIVNLLMRYYDPQEGVVFLDGEDVRVYEQGELKTKFGVAFQNDVIFRDTIYENIRFGRDLSGEEIWRAAASAQAEEFIQEKGMDSMLAIRGMNLSGGQKQRLLIARALAANPEILILDDSSSALDYATDARLRAAIAKNYQNLTTVIVAQRVSSILHADQILVMDDGEMIGRGTHEELMKTCEVYREISESQMGGADDAKEA